MSTMTKSYSELIKIKTFADRLRYLMQNGIVGDITFGGSRYLNQMLYKTEQWKRIKRQVIIRDNGCDLAHEDYPIGGSVYVHHIKPITSDDILKQRSCVFDMENLISTSFETHNLIHYGNEDGIKQFELPVRMPNDTCPWRR